MEILGSKSITPETEDENISHYRIKISCFLKTEKYIILGGQIAEIYYNSDGYSEGYLIIFNIENMEIYKRIILPESINHLFQVNEQIICIDLNVNNDVYDIWWWKYIHFRYR